MKKNIRNLLMIMMIVGILSLSSCKVQKIVDEPKEELSQVAKSTTTTVEPELTTEPAKETSTEPATTTIAPTGIDPEVIKPNELGHIMVVMYHGIMDNPPYHRTKEEFTKDLQTMYDLGYRLITLDEYLTGRIKTEPGMTPIHLTFDDGLDTTFALKKTADGFTVDENTAIGILEDFCKEHPDFGHGASLYFHDTENNFGDVGTDKDRFDWLLEHGYELGNHTATHDNLSTLTEPEVIKEVGRVEKYVESLYPDMKLRVLTYPFGATPDDAFYQSALKGEYEGTTYDYEIGLREGPSGPFRPITHKDFQRYNAPRVRGSEGENGDLYWYFDYYEENPSFKFVSDGYPDAMYIPEDWEEGLSDYAKENFSIIKY